MPRPLAFIEIAKLHEHRFRDVPAALEAVASAERLVLRARMLGRPIAVLELDLRARRRRLTARLERLNRRSARARDLLAQAAANG